MCPNHIFVIKCIIHREAFSRFEIQGDFTFGVKMETLFSAINKADKRDHVTLALNDENDPVIVILEDFAGTKKVKYKIEQMLIISGDRSPNS